MSRQCREPCLVTKNAISSCTCFGSLKLTIHVNVEVWLDDSPLEVTVDGEGLSAHDTRKQRQLPELTVFFVFLRRTFSLLIRIFAIHLHLDLILSPCLAFQ
jgi:hypothetical protein